MKSEKEIAEFLLNKLSYAYCDNCKGSDSSDKDFCDDCHRKYQNWALRKCTAEKLAKEICK